MILFKIFTKSIIEVSVKYHKQKSQVNSERVILEKRKK